MKLTLTIASALAIIASSAVPQACASNGHTHSVQGGFQKQETFKMLHTRSPSPAQHNIKQNVMDMSHGDLESHRMDQGVQASSASKPKGAKPQPAADDMADPSADYSTSPPFYPTPETAGTGKWAPAVSKAKKLVKKLTNEEKVVLTTGAGWQSGHCVGNINPIERVGFPGLCLEDSPLGVRFADLVTVFPTGMHTAATFSSKLAYRRGIAMGQEHKGKGVNIQLGPGMNLHRSPAAGRNWEMCGADPYLCGEAAYHTIHGVQSQGVQANAKHYLGNEQEHFRETSSSNIDDRTMREVYEHPFLRAVQADVASFMCSYNLLNNSWACQNSELLNRRLKTDMGFQGYVMSDWGATHSGVGAANAGLDVTMPGDVFCCSPGQNSSYFGRNLTMAVQNGSVAESRLDDMATRILAGWYLLGQDKNYPPVNFDAFKPQNDSSQHHVNVMSESHSGVSREIAAAGTVILKNKNHALPLHKPKKIAVIGSDAGPSFKGADYFADRGGVDGTLGIGWGSGTADYAYFISPYEAIQQRARKDHTGVYWSFDDFDYSTAQGVATSANAALVFLQSDSGEGYITVDNNAGDRNNLTAWHDGDELVKQVAAVNPNTIVVIHAPGQLDVEQWVDNENVTAIVWAGMPGSESGNGLVDVLYGDVNPSGRLPFTIAKQRSDYPADVMYTSDATTPQIYYSEGLNIDYRHFDKENIEPRYEFGYGQSYTTFHYLPGASGKWIGDKKKAASAKGVYPKAIFEPVYEISFELKNVGHTDGWEVPQVYLGFPANTGEPPKVLRKFDRYFLKAGESKKIKYQFSAYDLSIFDVTKQQFVMPSGKTTVMIGASSRDIRRTFAIQD